MHRAALAGTLVLLVALAAFSTTTDSFYVSFPAKYMPLNIACDGTTFATLDSGAATCPATSTKVVLRTANGTGGTCQACTIDVSAGSLDGCTSPGFSVPSPLAGGTIALSAATTFTGPALAANECAAIAPPPTSEIDLGIYPVSMNVSAGAKAMPYRLQYYVVNQKTPASAPFSLYFDALPSGFELVPGASTSTCPISGGGSGAGKFTPSTDAQSPTSFTLPATKASTCTLEIAVTVTEPSTASAESLVAHFVSNGVPSSATTAVYFATGGEMSSASRTLSFSNQCAFPVALGISGARAQTRNPQAGDACRPGLPDCVAGSSCVNTGTATAPDYACFWDNPEPSGGGGYVLEKDKAAVQVEIPVYDSAARQYDAESGTFVNQETAWSGAISGRLMSCQTEGGDERCTVVVNGCEGNPDGQIGACKPGNGFGSGTPGPISQLEPTFLKSAPVVYNTTPTNTLSDSYDLTLINGVTVPMSMKPSNAAFSADDPYVCTAVGLGTPIPDSGGGTLFGACQWYETPAFEKTGLSGSDYLWLQYDAKADGCDKKDHCTDASQRCGLMIDGKDRISKKCGTPMGPQAMYWTDDQICAADPSYGDCPSKLGANKATLTEMLACTGDPYGNSCYKTRGGSCCGCVDWQSYSLDGVTAVVPSSTTTCDADGSTNAEWRSEVLPRIAWIKNHCPTAYTYPFDDKSSGVACQADATYVHPTTGYHESVNVVDYEVVFCP